MRIVVAAFLATLTLSSTATGAVEYVKVCNEYNEPNWYYVPGTEICVNAITGETRENGVSGETDALAKAKDANEGVALSLALPGAVVESGKTFGAAANFGTFNGESAFGVSGAISPMDGLTINGAIGVGLSRGTSGGRAGINYSW